MFKSAHTLIPFLSSEVVIETCVVARVAEEGRETWARGAERCNFPKASQRSSFLKVSNFNMLIIILYTRARSLSRLVKLFYLSKRKFLNSAAY